MLHDRYRPKGIRGKYDMLPSRVDTRHKLERTGPFGSVPSEEVEMCRESRDRHQRDIKLNGLEKELFAVTSLPGHLGR